MPGRGRKGLTRRNRNRYEHQPYLIFKNNYAAAVFLRDHPDYPMDRAKFMVGNTQPPYFPGEEEILFFTDKYQVMEVLDAGEGVNHGEAAGRANVEPYNEWSADWSPAQGLEWKGKRASARDIRRQQQPAIDAGWRLERGVWINDHVEPEEGQNAWEQENYANEEGYANHSGHAEFQANEDDVLEDIDEAALRYLRLDMLAKTGGQSTVYEDGTLNPSGALSCIKLLLRAHGTKATFDHFHHAYPRREIERHLAKRRACYQKKEEAHAIWEASGHTDKEAQHRMEMFLHYHDIETKLVEQLKLTTLSSFSLIQLDTEIQKLAQAIYTSHACIARVEQEQDRWLPYAERVSVCLAQTGVDITHSAAKLVQISTMLVHATQADFHHTRKGQKVVQDELENAVAVLKMYSILDLYGGEEGERSKICALVSMEQHDDLLFRLAYAKAEFRLPLYKGRLLAYDADSIPAELLKRSVIAFKIGISGAIKQLVNINKSVQKEGVRSTLSCAAGAVFGRLSNSLFGALRSFTEGEIDPRFAEMEHNVSRLRLPLTTDEVHDLTEAVVAVAPPDEAEELGIISGAISEALQEALDSGLDELMHEPDFRAFEVRLAGYNHYMYYIFATKEWVEMDASKETLYEKEAEITRYAIFAMTKAREIKQEERMMKEIDARASEFGQDELQDELHRGRRIKPTLTFAGDTIELNEEPSAAQLAEIGSFTGILDQQDFAGRVNEARKLEREMRELRAYLVTKYEGNKYEEDNMWGRENEEEYEESGNMGEGEDWDEDEGRYWDEGNYWEDEEDPVYTALQAERNGSNNEEEGYNSNTRVRNRALENNMAALNNYRQGEDPGFSWNQSAGLPKPYEEL